MSNENREQITFWLDSHSAEVRKQLEDFLGDVADVLKVERDRIEVLSIIDGCCLITLEVPREGYDRVMEELQKDASEPEWLVFKQKWRIVYIYDRRKKGKSANIKVPVRVVGWADGRTLTWLHLSDIHWKSSGKSAVFVQGDILNKLLTQLPGLLRDWQLRPDLVFVTGDVGHSGKPAEYDLAYGFFEKLQKALPDEAPLYFIPGNHDSDSTRVDAGFDAKFTKELNEPTNVDRYQEVLASHLLDDNKAGDRASGFAHLAAYNDFAKQAGKLGNPAQNHEYFFTTSFAKNGVKLGIAGLNSAWRCAAKLDEHANDFGRLALGLPQVQTALQALSPEAVDATVALVHHPPDSEWYSYFDRFLHKAELPKFDFVLHGHEHVDDSVQIKYMDAEDSMVLAAGALYDSGGYPKTFKAVRFNLDSLLFQIYFWRYSNEKRSWLPDPGPAWKLGFVQGYLGTRLRKRHARSGAAVNGHQKLPPITRSTSAHPKTSQPVQQ